MEHWLTFIVCYVTLLIQCKGDQGWINYDVMSDKEVEYLLLSQQEDVNLLKVDTKWLKYMIGELKNKSGGLESAVHRISRSATQMLRENKELTDKINTMEKAMSFVSSIKIHTNYDNDVFKKKNNKLDKNKNKYYYAKQDDIMPSGLKSRTGGSMFPSSSSFNSKYADKYAQQNRPAADQPMEDPIATVLEKGFVKIVDIPSPTEKKQAKELSELESRFNVMNSTCTDIKDNIEKQQVSIDDISMNVEILKDKGLAIMQRIQRLEQGYEGVKKDMRSEKGKNKSKMRRLEKRIDEIDNVIYSLLTKLQN